LDGKSVPIEVTGRRRDGPLQIGTSGAGFRLFSIDYR